MYLSIDALPPPCVQPCFLQKIEYKRGRTVIQFYNHSPVSHHFGSLSFLESSIPPDIVTPVSAESHVLCRSLKDSVLERRCSSSFLITIPLSFCSFSPPVVSAVIDMPPAINQLSSRAECRLLSERAGLASLEGDSARGRVYPP